MAKKHYRVEETYSFMRVPNRVLQSRQNFSLNPVIPTVYTGQSRSRSYNFVLSHFLNLEGHFPWVMIFLTSIDPLKSIVTVRRELISFHQNDDIVHFRSFQSFARITYASHGNDFLSLNFDHGQTYRYRQVSIKETNKNFNKNTKGHGNPRQQWPTGSWHVRVQNTKNLDLLNSTPPNGLSSLSLLRLHFQSSLDSLTP